MGGGVHRLRAVRLTAGEVGAYFAFAYDEREDQNMTAYLLAVKTQWEQAGPP